MTPVEQIAVPAQDSIWALTDADRRGVSPLFWSHANLYGRIEIDMHRHIDLGLAA